MLVKELFEASRPGRAWSGKIKKIDDLLAWMYDKDILTATDKKEKDRIFYAYYRYYNDGDLPGFLRVKGVSKHDTQRVEEELEKYLEAFIKKMLAKYLPKIDRTEFRYDTILKNLETVKNVAKRNDSYGLLEYWLKKVKIKDEDGTLAKLVNELQKYHDSLKDKIKSASSEHSNKILSAAREYMKKDKTWTKDMEKDYIEVSDLCSKVANFISSLMSGISKLKALHALDKE